jgi:hypothetical protein
MNDVLYIVACIAFFALSVALVAAFERMRGM